jgi:hypothetical protein
MLVVLQKRCEVVPMLPVNEYDFYELAMLIHPLTAVPNEAKYSDLWYEWYNARTLLNTTFVERRPLSVCRPAADELYQAMSQFVPETFEDAVAKVPTTPDDIDPTLAHMGYAVRKAAREFETVLRAELQSMDTYFISQKGSHKTRDLIENARIAIPESVRNDMTEQGQLDFDQGGKCLVFDIPTAAGFHLLRSTESVLRQYYKAVTGKEPKSQMRNWGAYLKNLRAQGAADRVTYILEHIRVTYRNPVQHPDENLTEEQAQVLFGVCVSAITLMISEIKRLSTQSAKLQFPAAQAIEIRDLNVPKELPPSPLATLVAAPPSSIEPPQAKGTA